MNILIFLAFALIQIEFLKAEQSQQDKYFEIQLKKTQAPVEIDLKDIIDINNIEDCNSQFKTQKHSTRLVTQSCFEKDVFFTVEMLIGNPKQPDRFEVLNLAIDLHSPWTWVKTEDCQKCEFKEQDLPVFYKKYNDFVNKFEECEDSCGYEGKSDNNKEYNPKSSQIRQVNKHGVIEQPNSIALGQFFFDNAQLLVYDTQKPLSLKEYARSKLKKNDHEDLRTVLNVKRHKFIGMQKLVKYNNFKADGSLGLGFFDSVQDDSSIEEYTNILESLLQVGYSLPQVFGLYLSDPHKEIPDQVITLGGFNIKYSLLKEKQKIIYLDLHPDRAQNWASKIEYFKIQMPGQPNASTIKFSDSQAQNNDLAIFSASASYIALPKSAISQLLSIFNSKENNATCEIVDSKYNQIHCKTLKKWQVLRFSYEIKFAGQNDTVTLDGQGLFGTCAQAEIKIDSQSQSDMIFALQDSQEFSCLLNIRVSLENKIILGMPFMMQHYTIFDEENNKIGLMWAMRDKSWIDMYSQGWFKQVLNWITAVFIFGMIFICSYRYMNKFYKRAKKFIKNFGTKHSVIEVQNLNIATESSGEYSYSQKDVETAYKDEIVKQPENIFVDLQSQNNLNINNNTFRNDNQ